MSFPRKRESFLIRNRQDAIFTGMTIGKMEKQYYVYILASKKTGVLYVGVTSSLKNRIYQHKNEMIKGFTEKYKIKQLVYFEVHNNIETAITREKQIKKWNRDWKIELIEKDNPAWDDLYLSLF